MISSLRKGFESRFSALGRFFSFLPPNTWTILSILPASVSACFILFRSFIPASIFLLLAGFLDLIDGSVARYRKQETKFGAFLDTIIDRWVEGLIILSLLLIELPSFLLPAHFWIAAYLFGSLLTTYVKAASAEKGLKRISGGILERPERILCLFIALFLAGFNPKWLVIVFSFLAFLSNLTAVQRMVLVIK